MTKVNDVLPKHQLGLKLCSPLHFSACDLTQSSPQPPHQFGVPLRWPLPHQRTCFHSTLNPSRLWISSVFLHGSACGLTYPPPALPTCSAEAALFNVQSGWLPMPCNWLFLCVPTLSRPPSSSFIAHPPSVLSFTILHHFHPRNTNK